MRLLKVYISILFSLFIIADSNAALSSHHKSESITIKILGVNDFHGQISAGRSVKNRPVGGAAVLAAYLHSAARGNENNTIITFMGDQVGASIPASGLLDHEPTILSLNTLANSNCSFKFRTAANCNMVATIGNHEFDRGLAALLDMINGTNKPPKNAWISLPVYPGAVFPYISANIVDEATGKPLFNPYVIKNVNGVSIAFIGIILKNAASSMLPENAKGIKFLDEAETINSYLPEIHGKGVNTIIVIMHQGGDSEKYDGDTRQNIHANGEIVNIVSKLDDGIDVVMGGHTHRFLNAYLPNHNGHQILVTQADSYSAAFAEVTLQVDRISQLVLNKSARIVYTFADKYPGNEPDTIAANIVKLAEKNVAPIVNAHVGILNNDLSRIGNDSGESSLGNLIADSFRHTMHTDIGITNSTSIRTDLKSGEITWGAIYSVQPFENPIVKLSLKGQDVVDLLEQQWKTEYKNILQVSGLSYNYDENLPIDHRVSSILVNGQTIDVNKTYTIAVNTFLANGGSGFTVLKKGKIMEYGATDLEMVIAYIKSLPQPFTAKIEGRINGRIKVRHAQNEAIFCSSH